jgi:hypothetical protein
MRQIGTSECGLARGGRRRVWLGNGVVSNLLDDGTVPLLGGLS